MARLTGQLSACRASLAMMASAACSLPARPFWRGVASGVGTGALPFQKRVPGMNAACDLQFEPFGVAPADFRHKLFRLVLRHAQLVQGLGPEGEGGLNRLADLEGRAASISRIAEPLS